MRTQEELVVSLHERMDGRKRMQERRKTGMLRAATAIMTMCLLLVIYGESAARYGGTAGQYSGATMIFENAGAYVLVALLAFMTGAAVSVACIHKQRKERKEEKDNEEKDNEES